MHFTCFLNIEPKAKARPRVTARGTYMPKDYQAWRAKFCMLIRPHFYGQKPLAKNIGISLRIQTKSGKMRPDLDNVASAVLDALQDAGVITNDRNMVKIGAVLCQSKEIGMRIELVDNLREIVL